MTEHYESTRGIIFVVDPTSMNTINEAYLWRI